MYCNFFFDIILSMKNRFDEQIFLCMVFFKIEFHKNRKYSWNKLLHTKK